MTPQEIARAVMSEAQLLATIRQVCRTLGLLCYHTYDSRRSEPGFPDLVIVGLGPGAVLYRELKSERGRLRPEQRIWLDALSRAGQDADVWRPGDFYSGRITRELASLRRRGGRALIAPTQKKAPAICRGGPAPT